MKTVQTVEDFFKYNDKDLHSIILKVNPNIHVYFNLEDVKQHFYLHLVKNNVIERYSPTREPITKFSTFIYRCIHNFIRSYYKKPTQEMKAFKECKSLDYFFEGLGSELPFSETISDDKDHYSFSNFSLDINQVMKKIARYDRSERKRTMSFSVLLNCYLKGDSDLEIAKTHSMTVAGVGVMKKTLRTLLKDIKPEILQ